MRTGMENQITLLLIRHGATESNQEHRYLGKTEETLMKDGKEELFTYKNRKRYPTADILFSSPMKRCIETAHILYPKKEPIIIPEWTEMDFGVFEGKNYMDLQGDKQYQAWIDSNGTLPFPSGESREAFILRCEKGFEKMFEQLLKMEGTWQKEREAIGQRKVPEKSDSKKEVKTVAAVVHGGTIMALLSRYYGGEYFDYQVSCGGGYVCKVEYAGQEIKIADIKTLCNRKEWRCGIS